MKYLDKSLLLAFMAVIVTDDVIESANSLVIPEAANREISAEVVIKRMLESL